jgi:hypothetical protein
MSGVVVRKSKPYRLVASVVAENELHEAVAQALDLLLLPPAMWTTFPAGSVPLPPEFAAKLYRMGLKRSWPDILVLHGSLFGIELKRVGAVLSRNRMVRTRSGAPRMVEGQCEVFPRLTAAGMKLAVCSSVDEVLAALREWRIPIRRCT